MESMDMDGLDIEIRDWLIHNNEELYEYFYEYEPDEDM